MTRMEWFLYAALGLALVSLTVTLLNIRQDHDDATRAWHEKKVHMGCTLTGRDLKAKTITYACGAETITVPESMDSVD